MPRGRVLATVTARHMPTTDLLDALPVKMVTGTLPPVIAGVSDDSRTVGRGECFIAVPGLRHDARRFIPAAVGRGAALVVTEGAATSDVSVAQVVVPSAREAVALLGDAWYGHPSRAMTLVGIHAHIGSQIFLLSSFEKSVSVLAEFVAPLGLPELCLGGGLGGASGGQDRATWQDLLRGSPGCLPRPDHGSG